MRFDNRKEELTEILELKRKTIHNQLNSILYVYNMIIMRFGAHKKKKEIQKIIYDIENQISALEENLDKPVEKQWKEFTTNSLISLETEFIMYNNNLESLLEEEPPKFDAVFIMLNEYQIFLEEMKFL